VIEMIALIRETAGRGVTFFDTAEVYGIRNTIPRFDAPAREANTALIELLR
jgi:aryl-alcohol dehydrogenase-like predicted oxidoreductase